MQHYRECAGMSEADAKVRYVNRCRSLKTYGVTFFLVKEKVKGKNKLVPRLLGVNKESVMRVDEKTKDVIKEWPLEQVRRWAASPNTFTLDFGDYQEGYYSVQTNDGEKIAQLIAGYIDIILKKKRAKDHLGIEGDEGSTMLEDIVSPAKATLVSHGQIKGGMYPQEANVAVPGVLRDANGQMPYSTDSMQRAQYGAISGQLVSAHPPPGQKVRVVETHTLSQRALIGTIETSVKAVRDAEAELDRAPDLPPLGDDPASMRWRKQEFDVKKHEVNDHLAAMGAATSRVVQLTGAVPDRVDHAEVGAAVSTISSNLPCMTRGVRTIAALIHEEHRSTNLIDATRSLCGAFSDFLNAVNPDHQESRQTVLAAAGRVGDYSHSVVQYIEVPGDEVKEFQDILIQLAKAVATSTAQLVLRAKAVSADCDDAALQENVIQSATQCAFATSQLVACARVVAPTIDSPACQEQLRHACNEVSRSVEQLLRDAQAACTNEESLADLRHAADQVSRALADLLDHIKTGPRVRVQQRDHELETIITSTDRLISYQGSSSEMIKQAKLLAVATTDLVSQIRGEAADETDDRDRLLGAARHVASATTEMIDAARDVAHAPEEGESQWRLRMAAEHLRTATTEASADELRRAAIRSLEQAARNTVSASTQTITAANSAHPSNRHEQSQRQLGAQCADVSLHVPRVINGIRNSSGAQTHRDEIIYHAELIRVCTETLDPCQHLVTTSRSAAPNVGDASARSQLNESSTRLVEALAELRAALSRAQQACSGMDLEYAIEVTRGCEQELQQFEDAARRHSLSAVPGETGERSSQQLHQATRQIGSSMAQMLSAAARGDEQYAGSSARDAADGLRLLSAGRSVTQHSLALFMEVRKCLDEPDRAENQERLARVAKNVSEALRACLACLPGQQDIDAAIAAIEAMIRQLAEGNFPPSSRAYQQVQEDLLRRASSLGEATGLIADSVGAPAPVLKHNVQTYLQSYKNFFNVTLEMVYHQQDAVSQQQMVDGLRSVSHESSRLLQSLKASAADPSNVGLKQQLTAAAKTVTESINRLIDACMSGAPWQRECDNVLRLIAAVRPLLDQPAHPINELSYFECLEMVTERTKHLGDGMTGISHYAKEGDLQSFCTCVRQSGDAVCGLAEGAAQAAYLVGVSDADSTPGRAGIVDAGKFARSAGAVRDACDRIQTGNYSQQQIMDDATSIARNTSVIANMCRDASTKTGSANAKRHFINCARDIAAATANLITAVKTLDGHYDDSNKRQCAEAAGRLLQPLDTLSTFVTAPEFGSVPADISAAGRRAQEPIVGAGRRMLDASTAMVQAAKALAGSPKDPPTWQQLADSSRSVSESIKSLVAAIRERAPGQSECDRAIEHVNALVKQLDQSALAAINQTLQQRTERSEQAFYDQVSSASAQIQDRIEPLCAVAKRQAENLGHRVTDQMSYFDAVVDGSVGAASRNYHSKQQQSVLDQCKTTVECQLQLLYACKDSGGNPRATEYHAHVDEAAAALRDALHDLQRTAQSAASEAGAMASIIEAITRAITRVDQPLEPGQAAADGSSYVDCQTRMVRSCKEIARVAQELLSKGYSDVQALGPLALELSRHYGQLAEDCRLICASTSEASVAQRIRTGVQQLGSACIGMVKAAGAVRSAPDDQYAKRELGDAARIVSERVAAVLSALHAGSQGTQACINAASTVSGIIGDLDTTIMFATAGTLNPDRPADHFADHRDAILKTAKALVEDTKALVSGAASSQEQLAVAAQNAVRTIVHLSDVVKSGAAALTSNNSEAQVLVIHAVKDVSSALAGLIQATKNASGKSLSDPAMGHLKEAAKDMVANVTSLLKTVKTVEDEHARGSRALEAALDSIAQEIRAYDSSEPPTSKAGAEEIARCGRPVTDATSKAVAAGQSLSQDDVCAAANYARKAVHDLLHGTKCAAYAADSPDARYKAMDAGREVALRMRNLLSALQLVIFKKDAESRQILVQASRQIAQAVTELLQQAESLKGADWVDPSDPTVIAENELLGAANSIEAAARKLSQLKPRVRPKPADESLNFDEQILEAARSIANAVQALVRAAGAAQRELVAQGRIEARPALRTDDYQWSEGLVSAARTVAAAVHSLCEAANALVLGHATEEKLISAAKQVASSTAHLIVACKVKADINSKSMQRLQAAGHAVKTATEHLVRAAKQSIDAEDHSTLVISQRMVSGIAQVMDAQESVLRKEKELDEARARLAAIRRAKYQSQAAGDPAAPPPPPPRPDAAPFSDF